MFRSSLLRLIRLSVPNVFAALGLAGCGGGEPVTALAPSVPTVASVDVVPARVAVAPGAHVRLATTARDAAGNVLSVGAVTWASGNASVTTVDNAGLLTAVGTGTALVSATVGGRVGTAVVSVANVASVDVAPVGVSLAPGSQVRLTARLRDNDGNELTGQNVVWKSGNTAVATVDDGGLVSAVRPGVAAISATYGTVGAFVQIVVIAPPPTSRIAFGRCFDDFCGIFVMDADGSNGGFITQTAFSTRWRL